MERHKSEQTSKSSETREWTSEKKSKKTFEAKEETVIDADNNPLFGSEHEKNSNNATANQDDEDGIDFLVIKVRTVYSSQYWIYSRLF
ncbi:5674_t:CDS:2 [Funneliformis geosporum]|uniref:5674_t:CDS:1 n=1 Tax=Funneliformis geosporum TaxID=1117311 RepID=A0A9W4SR28_9GLOM|nr:5674_t:CDS:2 [Funneliformis geosporum]